MTCLGFLRPWVSEVPVTLGSGIYLEEVLVGGRVAEGDRTRASISGAVVGTEGLRDPRTVSILRRG